MADGPDFTFRWEAPVYEVFPSLHDAQSAWLGQIDSLEAPDRKTHELIRMVCTVIARNPEGIVRHAMLAREVGDMGRRRGLDHVDRAGVRHPRRGRSAASRPQGFRCRPLHRA